jgi:hypothetical protein
MINGKGAVAIVVCSMELALPLRGEAGEDEGTSVTIVESSMEIAAPYVWNISVPPIYSVLRFSNIRFDRSYSKLNCVIDLKF